MGPSEEIEDKGGKGSLDEDREDDTVEPGAESLELRLVLLWGLSGAEPALLSGGMTPSGRPLGPLGKAPAEPGRKLDLSSHDKLIGHKDLYPSNCRKLTWKYLRPVFE